MGRTSKSFERKKPSYKPEPRILVLCEDTKSSKNYLEDAAIFFRAGAEIDIAHCGVTHPSGIVKEGLNRSKRYDHVYCVIDRDTHACFNQALAMAQGNKKLTIVPSYPCFEFWLILHYGHSRRPFKGTQKLSPGDQTVAMLRGFPGMENYSKGALEKVFDQLQGKPFEQARSLSPKILAQAVEEGDLNPSTEIHLLIDIFEGLSSPKKA